MNDYDVFFGMAILMNMFAEKFSSMDLNLMYTLGTCDYDLSSKQSCFPQKWTLRFYESLWKFGILEITSQLWEMNWWCDGCEYS